jgi:hypothetical protein
VQYARPADLNKAIAMTKHEIETTDLDISRRELLTAAGIGGAAAVASSFVGSGTGAAVIPRPSLSPTATPPVAGLHLQFGEDASSEMVVSWHTLQPVQNSRVLPGRLDGELEQTVDAKAVSYTDAKSGQVVCPSCEA